MTNEPLITILVSERKAGSCSALKTASGDGIGPGMLARTTSAISAATGSRTKIFLRNLCLSVLVRPTKLLERCLCCCPIYTTQVDSISFLTMRRGSYPPCLKAWLGMNGDYLWRMQGFALDKLHLTLTVFRENKNTTTRNLLSPLSDLVLAQRARQRKEPVRVECEQSCPAEQKPSYSRLEDCQQEEGGT